MASSTSAGLRTVCQKVLEQLDERGGFDVLVRMEYALPPFSHICIVVFCLSHGIISAHSRESSFQRDLLTTMIRSRRLLSRTREVKTNRKNWGPRCV